MPAVLAEATPGTGWGRCQAAFFSELVAGVLARPSESAIEPMTCQPSGAEIHCESRPVWETLMVSSELFFGEMISPAASTLLGSAPWIATGRFV